MQTGVTQTGVLAYIPSPPQGVWHLAGVPIRAYALFIIVGIVVAVFWGNRRWIDRGGRDGEVLDVAIWAVPFGLIGGRLYHLATDWSTYFGDGGKQPIDALKIWDGGLGIWGAVLLGAVGAWIGTRRAGISLPAFGDAIAPPILLAQAIGRLGNYFNQELFGADTTMPWGLKIYERTPVLDPDTPWSNINGHSTGEVVKVVQPTFLYELVWNVLIVIALVVIDRKFRVGHGRLFAMYVAGYCVGRFIIEALRHDHATHIFGLRINLFTAAVVFLCAAIYILLAPRGREKPVEVYRPGMAPDEYYDDEYYDEDGDFEYDGEHQDGGLVDDEPVDDEVEDDFDGIADEYADKLEASERAEPKSDEQPDGEDKTVEEDKPKSDDENSVDETPSADADEDEPAEDSDDTADASKPESDADDEPADSDELVDNAEPADDEPATEVDADADAAASDGEAGPEVAASPEAENSSDTDESADEPTEVADSTEQSDEAADEAEKKPGGKKSTEAGESD